LSSELFFTLEIQHLNAYQALTQGWSQKLHYVLHTAQGAQVLLSSGSKSRAIAFPRLALIAQHKSTVSAAYTCTLSIFGLVQCSAPTLFDALLTHIRAKRKKEELWEPKLGLSAVDDQFSMNIRRTSLAGLVKCDAFSQLYCAVSSAGFLGEGETSSHMGLFYQWSPDAHHCLLSVSLQAWRLLSELPSA
jgi:hypothetical protein